MSRVDLASHVGHGVQIVMMEGEALVECTTCDLYIGGDPDEGLSDLEEAAGQLLVEYGQWGEHPQHDRMEWDADVVAGGTSLGYWEWVANQIDVYDDEEEEETEDDDDDDS